MYTREQLLAFDEADYMSDAQLAYFKALLDGQLEECKTRTLQGVKALAELEKVTDEADLASLDEVRQSILRLQERERKNFAELREALARIDDRSFGYCEATGEPIGLARLLARPATSLCIDAQHSLEVRNRHLMVA